MATGVSDSQARTSVERTRRQLQELEQLLERMLHIPVADQPAPPGDEKVAGPTPVPDSPPESLPIADSLTAAFDEAAESPLIVFTPHVVESPPTATVQWTPAPPDQPPAAPDNPEGVNSCPDGQQSPGPFVAMDPSSTPPEPSPAEKRPQPSPSRPVRRRPMVHALFYALDRGFFALLGPVGRLMAADRTRALLGWSGLVLLAAAAGLTLGAVLGHWRR